MLDRRGASKVLLAVSLFGGACGGSTTTSARSKDAGTGGATPTEDSGAGGATATGGSRAGGAAGSGGVGLGGMTATGGAGSGGVGLSGMTATGGAGSGGVGLGGAPATGGADAGSAEAGDVPVTEDADASTTDTCVGSCVPAVCTPGTKICQTDAEKVVTCSEDGRHQDISDDCSGKSQVCVSGTCVPVVCAAGTKFCSGMELRACSAKGDSSTVVETCSTILSCNAATTACAGPRICTPNQPVCNGSTATTCNADGSGYAAGGTACTDAGKACYRGVCTECWPTAYFCSGSAVRQCAADGMSSTVFSTCTTSEYCDTATATCKAQVCAPNQPACNGKTATTCNADGSGYVAGGTECSGSAVCIVKGCITVACGTLSGLICADSKTVTRCYSGDITYFDHTCGSTEYCDSGTCKPLMCVPNRSTCDGNTATVCSANGLRYASGGTPCGAQRCVEGACQDALFAEDFEDGDLAGWQKNLAGESAYTLSATAADGAAGTLHSLMQKKTSTGSANFDGIYQTFADLSPTRVSWWVMAASSTAASGCFSLSASAAGTSDWIAFSYFKEDGTLMLLSATPASSVAIPYTANVWYHIELRNLDWTAKRFDYYVNGALIRAAAPFLASSATAIRRLDLFNMTSATVYWDQITFD